MAISSGPDIVNDGLILALDAANPKSYPGSGSEWYDISGNNFHMSLKNSPSFSSSGENKFFVLDGSTQYGSCDGTISGSRPATVANLNLGGTNPKTIVCIANMTGTGSGAGGLFDLGDSGVTGRHFCLRLSSATYVAFRAQFWGTPDYDFAYNGINAWTMFSQVYGADKIGKTYGNNGTLLGQDSGAFDLTTAGSRPFEMGRFNVTSYIGARIAAYFVYNKALTVDEIQQNYSALRGRFGL